jgi:ATP-dependent exoDNAse (exonuclease V) beta subunit
VHVLPVEFSDARQYKVDEYRKLEGEALAGYLRWPVERSDAQILDPVDRQTRRVRYGDIEILAVSTWRLSLLFPWLDAARVPYASRGGTLFLADPLHKQFLLGLRALADREDGVAEAALLRPPFFGLDPADLLKERAAAAGPIPEDEAVLRARDARELVHELRRRRFDRGPGVTARALLDRTAFARAVASGPNGAPRLSRLRELCLLLEQTAATEGLDYDTVTARLRRWVTDAHQGCVPAGQAAGHCPV